MSDSNQDQKYVLLLLAPGFEEGDTIYCVDRLREAGIPVTLLSISSRSIRGKHGIMLSPDMTLDQYSSTKPAELVIIPGGQQSSSTLMSDPRIYKLLRGTLKANGTVVVMLSAEIILEMLNPWVLTDQIMRQKQLSIQEFTSQLIQL